MGSFLKVFPIKLLLVEGRFRKELRMKTMVNRITLHFICIVIFPLCLVVLHGCSDFFYDYDIFIFRPYNNATFEQGDTITFSMNLIKEPQNPSDSSVTIFKGTIIQWTSDIDGDFWKEELDHDIEGVKDNDEDGWFASYTHQFSSSALSAGNHKITCKANARSESGTYNLATASIRISVTESQTSSTTTTTTDGGGNLDVTACTAIDDLEVRAGRATVLWQWRRMLGQYYPQEQWHESHSGRVLYG